MTEIEHCDKFILLLPLVTSAMQFSLDRISDGVISGKGVPLPTPSV